MKFYLIDDDKNVLNILKIIIRERKLGEICGSAQCGHDALEDFGQIKPDIVITDLLMPEMDGIAATAALRAKSNVPIILLTAKSETADKILGLNVGADDYITKPFEPVEVLARVRSQLRRYTMLGSQERSPDVITIGAVALDDPARSVTVDGEPVYLTPSEYNILRLLMQNPGKVFSSAQIYQAVWNETGTGSESAVAVHIRHLREKIEIDPSNPRYIKVVWGQGYKFAQTGREL